MLSKYRYIGMQILSSILYWRVHINIWRHVCKTTIYGPHLTAVDTALARDGSTRLYRFYLKNFNRTDQERTSSEFGIFRSLFDDVLSHWSHARKLSLRELLRAFYARLSNCFSSPVPKMILDKWADLMMERTLSNGRHTNYWRLNNLMVRYWTVAANYNKFIAWLLARKLQTSNTMHWLRLSHMRNNFRRPMFTFSQYPPTWKCILYRHRICGFNSNCGYQFTISMNGVLLCIGIHLSWR